MQLNFDDIRRHYSPDVLEKANACLAKGAAQLNVDSVNACIRAIVPDTVGEDKRVFIRLLSDGGDLKVLGECNCISGQDCEHIVAALIQAAQYQGSQQQDSQQQGAQQLPAAATESPERTETGTLQTQALLNQNSRQRMQQQLQLRYVLQSDLNNPLSLLIRPRVARKSGDNKFSDAGEYKYQPRQRPPKYLSQFDIQMLNCLHMLNETTNTQQWLLQGADSGQVFKDLLHSGCCHFGEVSQAPLKWGPSKRVEFYWHLLNNGLQILQWRIDGGQGDVFLFLGAPYYLDADKASGGELLCEYAPELIEYLLKLPVVSPEQIKAVETNLHKTFPDVALPTMQHFSIETLTGVKPVPRLLISSEIQAKGTVDKAYVYFDYAGHLLGPDSPSWSLSGQRAIKVERDTDIEQEYLQQILAEGFQRESRIPASDKHVAFVFSNDVQDWYRFQSKRQAVLERRGWQFEYSPKFRHRLLQGELSCNADRLQQEGDEYQLEINFNFGDEKISLLDYFLELLEDEAFTLKGGGADKEWPIYLPDGRIISLSLQLLEPLLDILLQLYAGGGRHRRSTAKISHYQMAELAGLQLVNQDQRLHWLGSEQALQLAMRLRNQQGVAAVTPPLGLNADLRPYQQRGLDWLQFLREFHLAGILADDMGLGKTLQTLAHLLLEKEQGRLHNPCLVVAPTSLMFNWRQEAAKFAPALKVLVLQGGQRKALFDSIHEYDLVLTTYPLLSRDEQALLANEYYMLILDEAQIVKNPKSKAARVLRKFQAQYRLCLTGTPLENHLGELWALFDFLLPGLLGSESQFKRRYRRPIEEESDTRASECLQARVRPFVLRRSKETVVSELPPKSEFIHTVVMGEEQQGLYETIRISMLKKVRDAIAQTGVSQCRILVLDALMKLRQVCCDPRLVSLESANNIQESAKLEALMSMLPVMLEDGRRILLFSQFTSMLSLIELALQKANIKYSKLTGQTKNREQVVDSFQGGEVSLFLISLKAGGTGLNLTAADTVIHYDPWWNPAAERQATDRAHRIGQDKPVFVYKFITEGTVEERILKMQEQKQALADEIFAQGQSAEPSWSTEDVEMLFSSGI